MMVHDSQSPVAERGPDIHSRQTSEPPHLERIGAADVAPGQYWRCSTEHPGYALAGDVLLVADVRRDGADDHRVDLHRHPRYGSYPSSLLKIHIDEFYSHWTFAADAQQVRAREMKALQRETADVQAQIVRAQSEPGYLNQQVQLAIAERAVEGSSVTALATTSGLNTQQLLAGELPSVSTYIEAGVTPQMLVDSKRILESAHEVTKARSDWFNGRVKEMGRLTQALMPYLQEVAAVPLAMVKRDIDRANDLLRSVETLNLFVGEDVTVHQVLDGDTAPSDSEVHLYQRRLFIDEEMAYFTQYASNTVSAESQREFVRALVSEPALLDLLVPAQRGVVLVAYSRQQHWRHKDMSPMEASFLDEQDRRAWLLVRDGRSAWLVGSPCGSHNKASMLFPELDVDGTIFCGINGHRITPESLLWTDRLDELQRTAIHYRRFAVVLSGMVSRQIMWKGLDPMQFLTASAADKMRYIRDASGEGVLGAAPGAPMKQWMLANRLTLRQGSLIVLDPSQLDSEAVPRFYSSDAGGQRSLRVSLPQGCQLLRVQREGQRLFVSLSANIAYRDSVITARVTLMDHGQLKAPGWLCVDSLVPEELDRLLSNRNNRADYRSRFALLHAARDHARHLRAEEAPLAAWLATQVTDAQLASPEQAAAVVSEAIAQHRATSPDRSIPPPKLPEAKVLLDLLFHRLKSTPDSDAIAGLVAVCAESAVAPLRLVMTPKGDIELYAVPREPDNRVLPQIEVERWKVRRARGKWLMAPLAEKPLFSHSPDEHVIHQWPAAKDREISGVPAHTKAERLRVLDVMNASAHERRKVLTGPMDLAALAGLLADMTRVARPFIDKHGRMPSADVVVPLAVASNKRGALSVLVATQELEACVARNWAGSPEELEQAGQMVDAAWRGLHAKILFARQSGHQARTVAPLERAQLRWIEPSALSMASQISASIHRKQTYRNPCFELDRRNLYEASQWLGEQLATGSTTMAHWEWAPGWDTASTDPIVQWLASPIATPNIVGAR